MRTRKEYCRRKLPHFQQPGQSYFVTFILAGAMPKGTMQKYSVTLQNKKLILSELEKEASKQNELSPAIQHARKEYQIAIRKYRLAYDKNLHNSKSPNFSLLSSNNLQVIIEALKFWEEKKLHNHAWCVMSNHVHSVLTINETDEISKPVYLEDILHSIKLFTARRINANENRNGQLWEHECFDTTIRNEKHFLNLVNYTIQHPVAAKLISDWNEWKATYLESKLHSLF